MQTAFPAVYTTLATGNRAPAQARNEVGRACHGWSTSTIDTAKLLVSELVTNAAVHGAGNIALAIARIPTLLRVEVTDAGTNPVRPLRDSPIDDEYGRGLHIVAALATAWGSRPGIMSDGHVRGANMVWFELRPNAPDIDAPPTATDGNSFQAPSPASTRKGHTSSSSTLPSVHSRGRSTCFDSSRSRKPHQLLLAAAREPLAEVAVGRRVPALPTR